VETDDAAHRDGEHAEGVVVPEVLLRGEGEPFEIVQGFDVVGCDAGLIEDPPVKADGMVNPLDDLLESLELQGLQHLARQCFEILIVDHGTCPPLVFSGLTRPCREMVKSAKMGFDGAEKKCALRKVL
jgi:hypothetical protein